MERFGFIDKIYGGIKARVLKYTQRYNFSMVDKNVGFGTITESTSPFDYIVDATCLDEGEYPDLIKFTNLLEGIITESRAGSKVLITCKYGRGRSGMLAVAYLIKIYGLQLEEAIRTTKFSRDVLFFTSKQLRFMEDRNWI